MKIKTAGLIDTALDWAVDQAWGATMSTVDWLYRYKFLEGERYSSDWEYGGPIIEREELSVEPLYTSGGLDCWQAYGHNLRYDDHGNYINGSDNRRYGPTPLSAAMRCYVASKLGDEVDVPEELLA